MKFGTPLTGQVRLDSAPNHRVHRAPEQKRESIGLKPGTLDHLRTTGTQCSRVERSLGMLEFVKFWHSHGTKGQASHRNGCPLNHRYSVRISLIE